MRMKRWRAALVAALALFPALALAVTIPLITAGTGGGAPQYWSGGIGVFAASSSNWNGATVTLKLLGPDGVTYISTGTNTTCTANCVGVVYLPPGYVEAVITGSPTSLYASLAQVER